MWLPFVALILVGAVAADYEHGWKVGNEYNYLVRSRTFTGLDRLSDQYSGILIKALLTVQPKDQDTLRAKVSRAQYANVHKKLDDGWDTKISDQMLELRDLPISNLPFEIKMKHGVIRDLVVDKEVPTWEVNLLKSIVSQLQIDTHGENAKRSASTQVPEDGWPYASFKAMEDSVGGKCEVAYDITPLPEQVLHGEPQLVPIPQLKGDGHLIEILKTKNYNKCEQRMDYHFGITGRTKWEPGSNDNGRFLSKSSTSRIVISGDLKQFTIQSSVTTSQMFVSPRLYDEQNGMVVSKMNLTLATVKKASNAISSPSNPESTGNLVYVYNNPFSDSGRRPGRPSISDNSMQKTDSSSSQSSSEERQRNGEKRQWDSSSSSSSSSSSLSREDTDFWQPKPTLEDAPRNPLLPFFVGYKGKAITKSGEVDSVKATKELVHQIASELEDPSSIPSEETLEKFTILTSLIRTMSKKEIEEAEDSMNLSVHELKKNDKSQAKKQNAWAVFRDSVTQAGTGPALMIIKNWIERRKVEDFEAADIVSRLPRSARTPTDEYIRAFFQLATNPEVRKERVLNNTALVAFSELARQALISGRSMHNRYPVHSFGRLAHKDNKAVLEEYIPYLSQQLKEAIKDGDSPRIQVYILALGNIGHPKIVSIFEPYLEGKEPVSDFQRMMMVAAFGKLTEQSPKLAQSVLYKIYLNTMEAHEVRCIAVYLLMKTNPPLNMLQRMADFTNYDTSKHVNSAVKSTLSNIAELKTPELKHMAEKARAAMNLLNLQEYSYQYSQGFDTDDITQDKNLAYKLIIDTIGSDDCIFPRFLYSGLSTSYGGFKAPRDEIAAMVSSVKALFDMRLKKHDRKEESGKSAAERIAEMLNIEPEDPVQVEGNLFWNTKEGIRFVPFDNHTIERAPAMRMEFLEKLRDGRLSNLNKLSSYEVTLSFPTETGLPFVYTLKIPTLVRMTTNQPQITVDPTFKAKSEIRLVYSKKVQGRIGFVVPFEHQQFIAGVDTNFQTFAPVKLEIEASSMHQKKSLEVKLWPLKDEQNSRLLHYSVVPYTASHNLLNLRPVLTDKNTQKVHVSKPVSLTESIPTEKLKLFKLEVETDGDLKEDTMKYLTENPLTKLVFPWAQQSDMYRKVDVFINLEDEMKEPIVFSATMDSMQAEPGTKDSEDWSVTAKAYKADKDVDSDTRRKRFMKEAANGIDSARSKVVDLRLETPGAYRSRQALTLTWARSNSENKARALLYWSVDFPNQEINHEVCAAANAKSTSDSPLDFEKTIRKKPKGEVDVDIRYGRSCFEDGQISMKAKLIRSDKREEEIRKSTIAKICQEEMKQGNKALRTCQRAINAAEIFDEMDISLELRSEPIRVLADKAVDIVKNIAYPDVRVDVMSPKNAGKNQIDIKMKLRPEDDKADITVHTSLMDVTFPDVHVPQTEIESEKMLSTSNNMDLRTLSRTSSQSSCVLDKTQAQTFDDRSYPLRLGKCWHVIMTTYPKENPDNLNEKLRIPEDRRVTVVARENEDGQKEVKITLGEVEIRLLPSGSEPEVSVNGKKIEKASYQHRRDDKIDFEVSRHSDGTIRLFSDKYDVDAIYDGKRIQIKASDKFRKSVRGLCGNFDGEPENDFTGPKNCLLQKPDEFLATYALIKDGCEGPALENAQRADKFECIRTKKRMSNVISDRESGRSTSESRNWGYHEGERQDGKRCNSYRTKVEMIDEKICFTTRPVPTCASGCQATETKTKNYQFHCMPQNQASLDMKSRVEKGANPDLSQKPVSLSRAMAVPLACRA